MENASTVERFREQLNDLWRWAQERGVDKKLVEETIPKPFGPIIAAMLWGDRTVPAAEIIGIFAEMNAKNQKEIIATIERLLAGREREDSVLVVGSGNTERVFTLTDPPHLGKKHVACSEHHIGGSGVNYSMRLLAFGVPTYPVISVGDDDRGTEIARHLKETAEGNGLQNCARFIEQRVGVPGVVTPSATIIEAGTERTIFTEELQGGSRFPKFAEKVCAHIEGLPDVSISAVAIGHVPSDAPDASCGSASGVQQLLTRRLVKRFAGTMILANPGSSQIQRGRGFWEQLLGDIDIFQLNLSEMRLLFPGSSLPEIIEWFQDREVTAVITLDRLGAVATVKDAKKSLILAWPFDLSSETLCPTGAGDAFGAGLLSYLRHRPKFDQGEFYDAIQTARVWAAHACTTSGGASACPDPLSLQDFTEEVYDSEPEPVQVDTLSALKRLLFLIDRGY